MNDAVTVGNGLLSQVPRNWDLGAQSVTVRYRVLRSTEARKVLPRHRLNALRAHSSVGRAPSSQGNTPFQQKHKALLPLRPKFW